MCMCSQYAGGEVIAMWWLTRQGDLGGSREAEAAVTVAVPISKHVHLPRHRSSPNQPIFDMENADSWCRCRCSLSMKQTATS